MKKAVLVIVILLLVAGLGYVALRFITPAIFSVKDGFTHTRNGELKLTGADSVEILNAVDECAITGNQSTDTVFVRLTINGDASQKDGDAMLKKGLSWTLEQRGSRAVASVDLNPGILAFLKGTKIYAYAEISVPRNIGVTVKDRAGATFYKNLQNKLTIVNEKGDIQVQRTTGDISIKDDRDDILLDNVTGNITLTDTMGAITVTKIKGDIEITDTSGPIRLTGIEGNIAIKDTRDAVFIETVKGNVTLSLKNRGSLTLKGISGEIRLND